MKNSLESDNLMAAMVASGVSPGMIPAMAQLGRRNSGNSIFDIDHRSENEMSMLGGGNPIDEENSQNQEEDKDDDDDANESKGSVKIIFEDPNIVEKIPRCIIHPQAPWKTGWNVVMLFLIIFLAMTVPYRIPFEDVTPPIWLYCDIVIDLLFIFDVSMNFFTAMEDDNGELCTDHKKIILAYMKSWFLIDVLSSIPISLIQKLSTPTDVSAQSAANGSGNSVMNVRIIKLSRLPRLYRLLRLLKLMRLYKSNKFIERISMQLNMSVTTSRLMKSFIMVFFLLHLVGCLWVTVAVLNPFDDPDSW